MDFELRQLQHFSTLYRLQNFRQAADELMLSQAALSKSIQKLEERLQLRLFDRTTRSVKPTGAGKHLFSYVENVLSSAADLRHETILLQGADKGEVRIGCGPYPPECLVSPALRNIIKREKDISAKVSIGTAEDMLNALIERKLDIVIVDVSNYEASTRAENNIDVELLPPEPVVALFRSNHPLQGRPLKREDAEQFPWATPSPPPFYKRQMPQDLRKRFTPRFQMESISACLSLVETTDTITLLPLSVAIQLSKNSMFSFSRTEVNFVTNMGIHTVTNRTLSPAAHLLVTEIRKVAEENATLVNTSHEK